jgi:hypothetical protein
MYLEMTKRMKTTTILQPLRFLSYLDTGNDDNDDNDDIYAESSYFNGSSSDVVMITAYIILMITFFSIAYRTIRINSTVREFRERRAISIILPATSFFMAIECLALCVDESIRGKFPSSIAITLYIMESLVAPGIFISNFTLTYIAYRIRSMPFFFVRRKNRNDNEELEGGQQGTNNDQEDEDEIAAEPLIQPKVLVFGMRIFTLVQLVLSIIVNFDVVWSDSDVAGKAGWMTAVMTNTKNWNPYSLSHVILALLPMFFTSISCLYFAVLLWRYGNELSMTIYTSIFNPWMTPLVGVVAMVAGQMPGPRLFPVLSNCGICVHQLSMLIVMFEIRKDLDKSVELGSFLGAVWSGEQMSLENNVKEEMEIDPSTLETTKGENGNDSSRSGILWPSSITEKEDHTIINNSNLLT